MKKIISAIFCLFILFTNSGCKNTTQITPVTSNLSFKAEVSFGEEAFEYQAVITPVKDNKISLELTDTESGMIHIFSGDSVTEKLYGIESSSAISALPSGTFIDLLYAVFSDISENEKTVTKADNEYYINGDTPKYAYTVYFGESGLPLEITETNFNISVIIKDATIT